MASQFQYVHSNNILQATRPSLKSLGLPKLHHPGFSGNSWLGYDCRFSPCHPSSACSLLHNRSHNANQGQFIKSINLPIPTINLSAMPKVTFWSAVLLNKEKTILFRQDVHLYLGKTDVYICPVTALLPHLSSQATP